MSQPHGFDIGTDGNLYIGSDDATMARLSPVTAKRYYQWNGWAQQAENIQFYNNDVYFLLRSTPQPGIYIDLAFGKGRSSLANQPGWSIVVPSRQTMLRGHFKRAMSY